MIDQLNIRLIKPEGHFKATLLIPSKLDYTKSIREMVESLLPIFSNDPPFYDDVEQHGRIETVEKELENWILRWKPVELCARPKKVLQCLNSINIDLFPNIKVVLIHFLTLPVTTCSAERSFSELRLLKTFLRSTMSDERLSA